MYDVSPPKLIGRTVHAVLTSYNIDVDPLVVERSVSEIPRSYGGDYGIPIMRFLRQVKDGQEKNKIVNEIIERLKSEPTVRNAVFVRGYINVDLDVSSLAKIVFEAVRHDGKEYGYVKTSRPQRIVVEHTSANPVHPLHIGHARNMSLGDTLAKLLRARGHKVQTRYYINDAGRQMAVLVYGIKMLGSYSPPKNVKIDHWLGLVYAITHTLVDVLTLKKEVERLREKGGEEYREKLSELDKLMAVLARLRERDPVLFDKLAQAISSDPNPEESIAEIMRKYEFRTDEEIVKLTRRIVEDCLKGFKETMRRMGVDVEVWDWESDLIWSSMVAKILEEARKSPYFTIHKGAPALNLASLQEDPEIAEKLELPKSFKIPSLILARSDGTTLYTTRDIAYTIKKFREFKADKVINVIAAEQRLEQLQVRLALIALGYKHEGFNLIHYAYEMVSIPGMSMSGRRGEYITLDELIEAAIKRAREEVDKRQPDLPEDERQKIAEAVGIGAVRYSLVSVAAQKPLTFNLEEALNFERNSAPYIQYTYARAHNILAKYGKPIPWDQIDYSAAEENELRRTLVIQASMFPYIFAKAADELKPELLVAYINRLADVFNKWYPQDHVIREPDEGKRAFKLALTKTVETILENTMRILGIPVLERL